MTRDGPPKDEFTFLVDSALPGSAFELPGLFRGLSAADFSYFASPFPNGLARSCRGDFIKTRCVAWLERPARAT